jgi:hypothetical protein
MLSCPVSLIYSFCLLVRNVTCDLIREIWDVSVQVLYWGRDWCSSPLQSGKPKNLLLSVKWTYQSSFMSRPQVGRAVTWIIRAASEWNKATYRSSPFLSSQYPKCLVLAVFLVLTYAVGARSMARSSGTVVSVTLWNGGWRTVILSLSISVPTVVTGGRVSRCVFRLGVRRSMTRSSGTVVSVTLWNGGWRIINLSPSISVPTVVTGGRVFTRGLRLGVRRNKVYNKN